MAQYCCPSIHVHYVKETLNKPLAQLQLEWDVREFNNDRSILSIVHSRMMQSSSQRQNGLVVLALEEMAQDYNGDPNQRSVCQLLAKNPKWSRQRDRKDGADARIIPIFTSNYPLHDQSRQTLQQVDLFQQLVSVEFRAITGLERNEFAQRYFLEQLQRRWHDIPTRLGYFQVEQLDLCELRRGEESDVRPLITCLRMLAYCIHQYLYWDRLGTSSDGRLLLRIHQASSASKLEVVVANRKSTTSSTDDVLSLTVSDKGIILLPVNSAVDDDKIGGKGDSSSSIQALPNCLQTRESEINVVIKYWRENILCPTVIVSTNASRMKALFDHTKKYPNVQGLEVDVSRYKMTKSLYDESDIPNLRDDIMALQRQGDASTRIVVVLACPSLETQLMVRELVEDSPSMTAFSSARSALRKDGILFCITASDEISPELKSRASLII